MRQWPLHPLAELWDDRLGTDRAGHPQSGRHVDRAPGDGGRRGRYGYTREARDIGKGEATDMDPVAELGAEGDATGHMPQNRRGGGGTDTGSRV